MPFVKIKENEPFDVALRRFKRACEKAGVLAEVRAREWYEKPTTLRKRDAAAAVKRHAKKVQRESKKFTRLYWFIKPPAPCRVGQLIKMMQRPRPEKVSRFFCFFQIDYFQTNNTGKFFKGC